MLFRPTETGMTYPSSPFYSILQGILWLMNDTRSPSPPPQYDNQGRRVNTREYRYRKRLEDERHKLVEKAMKAIPNYHPPSDYRRPTKTQEKIYVPVNDYPEINFSTNLPLFAFTNRPLPLPCCFYLSSQSALVLASVLFLCAHASITVGLVQRLNSRIPHHLIPQPYMILLTKYLFSQKSACSSDPVATPSKIWKPSLEPRLPFVERVP